MYIPKSLLVGLLFAAIGLAAGWMLHGSANDEASATAPAVLQQLPTTAGPQVPGGAVPGTTTAISAGTAAPPGGPPGTAVDGVDGSSATANTRTSIVRTPDGRVYGISEAYTPGPVVPTVPAVPMAPLQYPSTPPTGYAPAPPPTAYPPTSVYAPASGYPPTPGYPSAATPSPLTVTAGGPAPTMTSQALALQIPPFFGEDLTKPLPGTKSRGVAFSEWESYRSDIAGRNIMVTTDDSNVFRDRNGKLNGNTGDTDASGLNVTDATDSVIRGTESADEAPYQTVTQGVVDIATANNTDLADLGNSDSDDDGDSNLPDPGANGPVDTSVEAPRTSNTGTTATSGLDAAGDTDTGDLAAPGTVPTTSVTGTRAVSGIPDGSDAKAAATPAASAAVVPTNATAETDATGGSDSTNDGYDFPYVTWTKQISANHASAVHTDEGTTLASGQEAFVIGGDGYDDDDNRATGENLMITRDDDNVVLGGTGDVNAQIGDSEQGAVIMGVNRTFIQGGGAY